MRERLGLEDEEVELASGACLTELVSALHARHPALRGFEAALRYAVNLEFVAMDAALTDGDEVALIPPVAGGAPGLDEGRFLVTDEALSLDRVIELARLPAGRDGAIVTFVGVVRSQSQGRSVERLEYEAHEAMAEKVLAAIGKECSERWPEAQVAVHHRVGCLSVGDLAVAIAACAPHRPEAFAACRHVIERLKQDCPIWKREVGPDGAEWVGMGP